jgi:hypothetical protein
MARVSCPVFVVHGSRDDLSNVGGGKYIDSLADFARGSVKP